MNPSNAPFILGYLPMKVALLSQSDAVLPAYLGSTLRGAIGWALCRNQSAYEYLYRNRVLSGDQHDTVNPYIIIPPAIGENKLHAGEALVFHMVLMGDAVQHAQALVEALQDAKTMEIGAMRYAFVLAQVTNSDQQRVIWKNGSFFALAAQSSTLPCKRLAAVRQAEIRTLTPLRIRRAGQLLTSVDFPTLIRNITRRVEALTARYGGWVDTAEIERLQALSTEVCCIQQNLRWMEMTRYSNRLEQKMDFSGLMGGVRFEGELTPFVPWLYAAQSLHIGRNTTFGMGGVAVEFT